MKTTAEILDILRDFKAHYAEKYGIITLGLFGSAARGELKHFTKSALNSIVIPLPPLLEQKRIIEKIEQLMQLLK